MKKIILPAVLILAMFSCVNNSSKINSNHHKTDTISLLNPKIIEVPVGEEEKKYNEAYDLWYNSKPNESIVKFRKFIASYPKSSLADDAQRMIGVAYSNLGEYNKAIEEYNKVKSIYPNSNSVPVAIYDLAHLYFFELNDFDKAKMHYEEVINIATVDDEEIRKNALEQLNHWDEKVEQFSGYAEKIKEKYATITTIADGYDVQKVNLWDSTDENRKIVGYCINNEKVKVGHRYKGYAYIIKKDGTAGYCLEEFLK